MAVDGFEVVDVKWKRWAYVRLVDHAARLVFCGLVLLIVLGVSWNGRERWASLFVNLK